MITILTIDSSRPAPDVAETWGGTYIADGRRLEYLLRLMEFHEKIYVPIDEIANVWADVRIESVGRDANGDLMGRFQGCGVPCTA